VFNGKARMMNNFIYETKCRRCGDITKRTYAERTPAGFSAFSHDMYERSVKPRPYRCEECKELTAQDVIFYGVARELVAPRRYSMLVD
jgi:hypothetical protein